MFQHTAARRRLAELATIVLIAIMFQHTAARRRLDLTPQSPNARIHVSTHSRPKAAGIIGYISYFKLLFQHTAARRRLVTATFAFKFHTGVSTHSRPKAAGSQLKL